MNMVKNFTTIHLQLNYIDVMKVVIFLMTYRTKCEFQISSNPCVGPSPRIKISFFFYYEYAQMSSYHFQRNDIFPMLLPVNENSQQQSNPMP